MQAAGFRASLGVTRVASARVSAADPEFAFKVIVEQIIGVGFAVIGDMSSRPNFGLDELDFVLGTLIVGSILNFSLMYLLAPVAGVAKSKSALVQFVTGDLLKKFGAPQGHMFERGAYGLASRANNFVYKALQFGVLGFVAGITGTVITNTLITLRSKIDPSNVPEVEMPPVIPNSGCWALHMAVSSNLRYQILNGLDMVLLGVLPQSAFRIYSTAVRSGNNILGGISFATIARTLGVQKSGDADASKSKAAAKK
ncbi:unnamed protein product [Pedinophyceae sp. YPF-701]|nr:unnamed protein product [Pedinophyceae sp. YPF-701]